MPHATHHVFFSYARADNRDPVDDAGRGWVTAFFERLKARHGDYSGHDLRVFFDQEEIEDGTDWRHRLQQGLRTSNLFLAFLSENYIRSKNCRWEWTEYVRREHTQARGDDGIATVYFVTVPPMPAAKTDDPDGMAALEADFRTDKEIDRWLNEVQEDLRRRQLYADTKATGPHPKAAFDLRPWYRKGPEILGELDAADRLEALRADPKTDEHDLLTLADRLEELDKRLATRLDRCLLADMAPGNLGGSYPHFVGRHRELRELHRALTTKRRGLLTAAHGMGGQGKTALAVQYAFAYAEFYAAGGRWLVPSERKTTMAECLLELARDPALSFVIPEEVAGNNEQAARWVLHQLDIRTKNNAEAIRDQLRTHEDRQSGDEARLPDFEPRCLIILDNVDRPELLDAQQLALLPETEWLEVVVTTRLDPRDFGAARDGKRMTAIPVDSLPIRDAVALLREFREFESDEEEVAAQALAEALGGYTLVEVVAAYLAAHKEITAADFLKRMEEEGLTEADTLAEDKRVGAAIRHREKQLAFVLDQTLALLEDDPAALTVLNHASLMAPDFPVTKWLKNMAAKTHPELAEPAKPGHPNRWTEVWHRLEGLRLLTPASDDETARGSVPRLANLHRMVAEHLFERLDDAERAAFLDSVVAELDNRQSRFEHSWQHDANTHWLLRPLEENLLHILQHRPNSHRLALGCGVAAQAHMTIGQLASAEKLLAVFVDTLARNRKDDLNNKGIARLHSVAQNERGAFLMRRRQPGDAEKALSCFQRSLEIREDLYRSNPGSGQAARDVSVSHFKFFGFHRSQGREAEAVEHLRACFAILDGFARAGRPMDPAMRRLHEQLRPLFSSDAET